jgi:Transposase IS116/IS110/IS902 family
VLPKYAGIAPVTERSGHTSWGYWRLQCPTFLRHTVVDWAAESIRHAYWARAYYAQQRQKVTSPQAAVRALAFQWLRVVLRWWERRTPYEESIDRNALKRRGSPLLQQLASAS